MKKSILILTLGLFLLSCGGEDQEVAQENVAGTVIDEEKYLADLNEIEEKLKANNPDKKDLKKAVIIFRDYAKVFPDDAKAPEYLLKSSDVALTIGKYDESVKTLEDIIENYPDYEKIESVYYNRASHTDFELRDTALARTYYTEFIQKFPNSDFVDDAQARIDQNFMSIEDLVNSFMANVEEDK